MRPTQGRGRVAKRSRRVQGGQCCPADGVPPRVRDNGHMPQKSGKPPGLGPAAPMRRRSCRGAGSTTAALALKTLLATHRRAQILRPLHRAHRGVLHHRTVETFAAPHEAASEAAVATAEIITALAALAATETIAAKPLEPAQHRKPPLLVLVEAVVERPRRIAELLERVAGL